MEPPTDPKQVLDYAKPSLPSVEQLNAASQQVFNDPAFSAGAWEWLAAADAIELVVNVAVCVIEWLH